MGSGFANTRVFWDLEDYPIPHNVKDLSVICLNIKKAVEDEGYMGHLSFFAYGAREVDEEKRNIGTTNHFTFFQENDKEGRLNSMLMDMIFWATGERRTLDKEADQHTHLMVIAKDVPEKYSSFFKVLSELDDFGFNIFLVLPDDGLQLHRDASYTAEELLDLPLLYWRWTSLIHGEPPFHRYDGSSLGPSVCRDWEDGDSDSDN